MSEELYNIGPDFSWTESDVNWSIASSKDCIDLRDADLSSELTTNINFAAMPIVNLIPDGHYMHSDDPDEKFPEDLAGAEIIAVGRPRDIGFNDEFEGGLVIDYQPTGGQTVKRVVFGFNDLAMWIEWNGYKE